MSADLKKSEEIWAEHHVILQYDRMAVTLLEYLVQPPSIVLRQPCVTRLHTVAHPLTEESLSCLSAPLCLTHRERIWHAKHQKNAEERMDTRTPYEGTDAPSKEQS